MTVREFFQNAWVPNFKVEIADARNGGIFTYFMGRFEWEQVKNNPMWMKELHKATCDYLDAVEKWEAVAR